jgi:hypothetical protein
MGNTGKKVEPPKPPEEKPKTPPPPQAEEDDWEDGDFVSPKSDRHGDDDEPI